MGPNEVAGLAGLIKEYKPKKIVELGIAAGGSTCAIMKTLECLNMTGTKVISLDLNNHFYRNIEKEIGYIFKENREEFSNYRNHTFLTGKYAVERLEEIGGEIDLLFLDTAHLIPGEILDFLLLLPYLSKNAIVALHDTNLHNCTVKDNSCIATRVLVNTVKADKFLNDNNLNFTAFQISQNTFDSIEDVFASLLLPWGYSTEDNVLYKYREEFKKHYSSQCIAFWDSSVEAYRNKLAYKKIKSAMESGKKLYIYGCGFCGRKLRDFFYEENWLFDGMLLSDGIELSEFTDLIEDGEKLYHFSEVPSESEDCIILLATIAPEVKELLENSEYEYIDIPERFFWFI